VAERVIRVPRWFVAVSTAAITVAAIALGVVPSTASSACPAGATINVVAHPDDDLLFLSPDLLHNVQAGQCVRTVFITAGDADLAQSYWLARQEGIKAAYARMAGVANNWTTGDAGISGHPMPMYILAGRANVSLVFMRLPDGFPDGSGGSRNGNQSLQKLDQGTITRVTAVDGSSSYTRAQLVVTLTSLMTAFQPDRVNTQDYYGSYGDGDHSDHHAVARLANDAQRQYLSAHTTAGYLGYPISDMAANVSGSDFTTKRDVFLTYSAFDSMSCSSVAACTGQGEDLWWQRQYQVSVPTGVNVALVSSASASSQDSAEGQTAAKAIDNVIDGYPGDSTKEWATVNGRAGSWIKLTWPSPQLVNRVVLYDRPNTIDQVTAGTLTFSDGTSVSVGSLPNAGAALNITFSPRAVTSAQFTATAVSASTESVGLAEFQVWSSSDGGTTTSTMSSTTTTTTSSTSSTTSTSTSSTVSTTSTTTSTATTQGGNLAGSASVTASSQDTSTGQTAAKAIDGVASGYPADFTKEWATVGGRAGSWITLTWPSPVSLSKIVLYDRPNSDDRVMGGTLTFSDGSVVNVGSLPNNGAAFSVSFVPRVIVSVRFTVTSVSRSTANVGLAEIEAY
jgi:LmbE family N-acetylglucosaminyl deacetylase